MPPDATEITTLMEMPTEVLLAVASHAQPSLWALALCSKHLYQVAIPKLYHSVHFPGTDNGGMSGARPNKHGKAVTPRASINVSIGFYFLGFMGRLHYSPDLKVMVRELCLSWSDHKNLRQPTTTFTFRDFPSLRRLRLHIDYLVVSKPDEDVANAVGGAISTLKIHEALPPSLEELQLEMATYLSTRLIGGQQWFEFEEFVTRLEQIVGNKTSLPALKKVAFGNPKGYALYPARSKITGCSRGPAIKAAYRDAGIQLYCWPEGKESPGYGFWERQLAWDET